jgi:hypothetical protein
MKRMPASVAASALHHPMEISTIIVALLVSSRR